jgi:hypothetical protein
MLDPAQLFFTEDCGLCHGARAPMAGVHGRLLRRFPDRLLHLGRLL